MKKYKVHFSIFNLFNETQAEVSKLQTILKTISAAAMGTTWYTVSTSGALYVAIGGAVLDVLVSCLYFEITEVKPKKSEDENNI